MAWIEIHQSLINHKKTIALAEELDMQEVHVVGHLVAFWLWALDNVQDGVLDGVTPRMVERAAQWNGDSGKLVHSMLVSGFLNEKHGQMEIHDWFDYAGRLINKKKENAKRMREARSTKMLETKVSRATNVQNTNDAHAGATNQPTNITNQPTNNIHELPQMQNELELDLDTYCQEIEYQMVACGASPSYSAKGEAFKWIRAFYESKVPIDFIRSVIVQAYAKNSEISTFTYCAKIIKDSWARELAKNQPIEPIEFKTNQIRAAPDIDRDFLEKFAME